MLFEFCAENFTLVPRAIEAGAGRVELCDNLAVGGTSPSAGVIRETLAYAHERGVPVMCMVRPRGGSFSHDERELRMMEEDAGLAAALGADGIVLGCLGEKGGSLRVDLPATARVIRAARAARGDGRPLDVTFHMAFDELGREEQLASVGALAELGVTRVLTHGGPAGTDILANAGHIRCLVEAAGPSLTILPGGGITWESWREVAGATGATELHGTRIVRL